MFLVINSLIHHTPDPQMNCNKWLVAIAHRPCRLKPEREGRELLKFVSAISPPHNQHARAKYDARDPNPRSICVARCWKNLRKTCTKRKHQSMNRYTYLRRPPPSCITDNFTRPTHKRPSRAANDFSWRFDITSSALHNR